MGQKCSQSKNFIGAAKAFERAASLRYDLTEKFEFEPTIEDVKATVLYLEDAIKNYAAIHKYKHAGTLHYRCSMILRKINASNDEVDKHHEKALEYFTKPNHELKNRKRVDVSFAFLLCFIFSLNSYIFVLFPKNFRAKKSAVILHFRHPKECTMK